MKRLISFIDGMLCGVLLLVLICPHLLTNILIWRSMQLDKIHHMLGGW